jgi:hypothetical protein
MYPRLSICAVVGALAIANALPTSAISINLIEDSTTRLAFDLLWGPTRFEPTTGNTRFSSVVEGGSPAHIAFADVDENAIFAHVAHELAMDDGEAYHADNFDVQFPSSDARSFSDATLIQFDGVQFLPLVGDSYGARIVYGTPFPDSPPGLPDGGSTAALAVMGLGCVSVWGRWLRRSGIL